MLYQLKEYFIFFINSKNQYGIHSPFVYNLLTNCLYKKKPSNLFSQFSKYKKCLLNNKNYINVLDFGKGSKIFKQPKRKISKIAKIAGISNKKAKLLIKIVNYYQPKTILEIGTSLGLATTAIHLANPKSIITTLEGCPRTADIAIESFDKFNFRNINLIKGNFTTTLSKINASNLFDLIYFDGNHQKKATLNYFESCLKTIHNNSIFIFDDIHWSKEMTAAWKEIKQHPKVTVTLDVFYCGIVFFRKEQVKEHFIIRI